MGPNLVYISGSSRCSADRRLHAYELHPRFLTLEAKAGATAIEARLQLAALYAATGTELPDARSKLTGGEVALELMRQSWNGGPMTADEQKQLSSIPNFGQLTPALPMLCFELDTCARELHCLRPDCVPHEELPYSADAATEYTQRKQRAQLNARALLKPCEEMRVLGVRVSGRPSGSLALAGSLEVPSHVSVARDIDEIEKKLRTMLVSEPSPRGNKDIFPLADSDVEDNELARVLLAELSESWSAHQRMPIVKLAHDLELLHQELLVQHGLTRAARERVEMHLLLYIDRIPSCAGLHASAFAMRRAANLSPRVTLRDLACAAWEPDELYKFNPFLSAASVQDVLQPAVLEWLALCVLEDKLERMKLLAVEGNVQELERELKEIGRDWCVKLHPQWLVFEVEQRLQIRRIQHRIAAFCISRPGAITQLNMGEGKTRVILPMLILELAQPDRLVRLHFLSQLIDEAYYYLHRHLTASLMCRRLLRLPFHRDVKLTAQDVAMMRDCLSRCMSACGAVCVAPEHRLSLQLKWHELWLAGKTKLTQSLATLDALPFCDIFDESDEILHHKYQLIYAHGHNVLLPSGKERWRAVQTMLRLLQTSAEVAALLRRPNVARRLPVIDERGAGAFDDLRLLAGPALDTVRKELNQALIAALMDKPPYHMRWLRGHPKRKSLIRFITEPSGSLTMLDSMKTSRSFKGFNELQREQLLALRGLLAIGLVEHCLLLRHRVNYGVDPRRGQMRRVAVPYRASDTPALRAEYAQPDTLIILTHLSYYHTGLSRDEVKEALSVLLTLGPMAQNASYSLWLESAKPTLTAEQLNVLDHVNKLDVTSDDNLDNLHAAYRYNMELVNFWLDACVLPRETMQFPNRLVANAFNLTDNPKGHVIGFSGTKDNHLLLPLHVSQCTPDGADELKATDGMMCNLLLHNKQVVCLSTAECSLSKAVVDLAISCSASALIDAGAAMAGFSNREVADLINNLLPKESRLEGVVFFDSDRHSWYVLNRRGRCWPQSSSPIHEKDAFVYFDESRCRGADMKLMSDAMAVLTVGPAMCKEKLMQAAGRMRKLDRGQKLLFAVPPELVPKIDPDFGLDGEEIVGTGLTSLDLLKWLMRNTAHATAVGIPEFSSQASHFCMTQDPKARLLEERLGLAESYGGAVSEEHVDAIVRRTVEGGITRCSKLGIAYSASALKMSRQIIEHAAKFGSDLRIVSTGVEEECERELENERELEREREVEVPKHAPQEAHVWDFSKLRSAHAPSELSDANVMKLHDAIKSYLSEGLTAIPWDRCRIFVTGAFMKTVTDSHGAHVTDLSEFMRPPDALVVFPSSDVLLLSEWEADQVLPLMWQYSTLGNNPSSLVNLIYLREAADQARPFDSIRMRVPTFTHSTAVVDDLTLAGLQLLAGETMFATAERKASIRSLVEPTTAAKKAALQLVSLRGRQHMISRSDLELVCNADIGEG